MSEAFDLQEYMTEGVRRAVSDAIRATFKDPKESAFMLRFAAASKRADAKRREAEDRGEHIPPFLIASITSAFRKDCRLPAYAEIDMSIAMENMWLRTDELGLGGVWFGIASLEERMKAVEDILSMPKNLRAFAVFPFGYPAEERIQADRFEEDRIHWL